MGRFDLNLSSRPFRPYRAVNFGLGVLFLVLLAVSAYQVYRYRQYAALAASIREEERMTREEADRLSREVAALNARMSAGSTTAKLSEVEFLNALLLRKSFSWTRVFASLEEQLPDDVHLVTLGQFTDDQGRLGFNMTVRGRSLGAAADFVRVLETSKTFGDIAVAVEEKQDALPTGEVEMTLSAYYFPEPKTP
jgi:type IV pilus assembly protein PilN